MDESEKLDKVRLGAAVGLGTAVWLVTAVIVAAIPVSLVLSVLHGGN
jgi:uncharacterized membrane protein (GlpM family)